LVEKSSFPRHKVCGEFLSPGVGPVLELLGVWQNVADCRPAAIRRLVLHFGERTKICRLPECAWGLSRYRFDRLLFEKAVTLGAEPVRERLRPTHVEPRIPAVLATGRNGAAPRGERLFGFKAHFEGPVDDGVELFFFSRCYVGVSPVEEGLTNVCGLAPEPALRACGFNMDALLPGSAALCERLRPLSRRTDWLTSGPVVFSSPNRPAAPLLYPAGDALGFIDPFTGTGILNALLTGRLAGIAAVRGLSTNAYMKQCARVLDRPFHIAPLLRAAIARGWAEELSALIPARLLFRLTRPNARF
jgi:hypothetical protein